MTRRLNLWLLVLALLILPPFWWLFIDNSPGRERPRPVHISELRQLAASLPGPRPTTVQYTVLATRATFGDLFAAGIGLKRRPLAIVSWMLPVPGAGPILIDADASPEEAWTRHFRNFNSARQRRIDVDAAHAGLILASYQPIAAVPPPAALRHDSGGKAGMAGAMLDPALPPLPGAMLDAIGSGPQAAAPGVVTIPAPDYAPGARMIYVQLADHREFLFAGDISALDDNWSQLRARSLLAAHWLAPQNRAATYPWLWTIRQLKSEAPQLTVVPGNDYSWLINQRNSGKLSEASLGLR